MVDFFRFPHTPHLAWLGSCSPRDDKVLSSSEARVLLAEEVVVEEKLDGANLGFSIGPDGQLRTQNRGQYLGAPFSEQFSRLNAWLALYRQQLLERLSPDLILFGEWCAARHSVAYAKLPDWFLGFDIFDRSRGQFWSTRRRDILLAGIGITAVPRRLQGKTDAAALEQFLISQHSAFLDGPMEGLIIRREDSDWLTARAKLVRADFTQAITEHWKRRKIEWNQLARPELVTEL